MNFRDYDRYWVMLLHDSVHFPPQQSHGRYTRIVIDSMVLQPLFLFCDIRLAETGSGLTVSFNGAM